jgi:hypothetical protein
MSIRLIVLWGLLLGGAAGAGCVTHADRLTGIRSAYYLGDLHEAQAQIGACAERRPSDADVLKLDEAIVLLCDGKPRQAEKLLREVRDRFDHLEQTDVAEQAWSMFTDDQRLAYAGEDYEKVMIRAFLALANLLGDSDDAGAYALQVSAKQQQIIELGAEPDGPNPKESYKRVGLGAYIQAVLREQTHVHYDDAARSMELVCQWEPDYRPGAQELERLQKGRHSTPGHGVVYVFTLVGRGPYKEQRWEVPTTAALLVADRVLTATGKHSLPPTIAPIKVPRVVTPANDVLGVRVAVDGQDRGQTETVTDVGKLAEQQAEAVFPQVLGRAIARRIVKKAVVYGLKEGLRMESSGLTNLALDAVGVVWEFAEAADTRCWGLLPQKIQVLRIELPAGRHQLTLQPLGTSGSPVGKVETTELQIDDGRNTYVLANFPSARLVGRIVANPPAP